MESSERIAGFLSRSGEIRGWGYRVICGLDEVGRGAMAGPVAAGAVALTGTLTLPEVDDSKRLSPTKRRRLARLIFRGALAAHVGYASAREIDRLGIVRATQIAMLRALEGLSLRPDHLVLDAFSLPGAGCPQIATVRADSLYEEVAAASIIAKVSRDALMERIASSFPAYGWAENKGYGSIEHRLAIRTYGPTPWHRLSFLHDSRAEGAPDSDPRHSDASA